MVLILVGMLFNSADFPTASGVYLMKDARNKILYVGKAKNLRRRLEQYFSGHDDRDQIQLLLAKVVTVDVIVVESEKEALLLEHNLIKEHRPHYNICLKDDKGYAAIKLTKHKWPTLSLVHYKNMEFDGDHYFGPYTSSLAARDTLLTIKKMFPMRRCSDRELSQRKRPCILYGMKQCLAPCVGKCTEEEYLECVKQAKRFLKGNVSDVLKDLEQSMHQAAEELEFERADAYLRTINSIKKTVEKQHVDHLGGDDVDAIALYRKGGIVVVACLVVRHGKVLRCETFCFDDVLQGNDEILESFLLQHYHGRVDLPGMVVVPERLGVECAEIIGVEIKVPQRGEKRHYLQMAYLNGETKWQQQYDEEGLLTAMQQQLVLKKYPRNIVCFDVAHTAGSDPVGVAITFVDGKPSKKVYRKYRLSGVLGGDDYGSMKEVVSRYWQRNSEWPDLVVIDGGRGHLNVVADVVDVDLISVAKDDGDHGKGLTAEKIFVLGEEKPILLERDNQILFLLQRIRDEAHRFAITWHQRRRGKSKVRSKLEGISGIGPSKSKGLLDYFGSVQGVIQAKRKDLEKVPGLTKSDVDNIIRFSSGE